jgi:retron-type reverse transcriptase
MENIKTAHENARKGKSHYHEVKKINADPDKYLGRIQRMLKNKTFTNSKYRVFEKRGPGKARTIHKLPYFPDRIIHHCIVQVLEPIWLPWLIKDTLACLKGRGIHQGVKRIRHALRTDPDNTKYCLKMDVKKFYPSMDHRILKNILARKIKDPDVMGLLGKIIDSTGPGPGVPIGNYLSQYFGNLYLTPLDHWIKEHQKCRYYVRYCDDMVILAADKKRLHAIRKNIETFLDDRLNLKLKENWQVFPIEKRGIDFLGYRFFPEYTLLRKSTALQFKRKMAALKKGTPKDPVSIASTVMSYWGWMKHANCLNLWHAHVDETIQQIVENACETAGIRNPMERSQMI